MTHQAKPACLDPALGHTNPRRSNALARRRATIAVAVLLGVVAMTVRTTLTPQGASTHRETP
jgi:hypothetical protein